jgi:subtilase family serine protease
MLFAFALLLPVNLHAQIANRVVQSLDGARSVTLRNHHPLWANAANSLGAVSADATLPEFTLVLARSDEQEKAFEQFLADQQNPSSPEFHHWLTPEEVGARFGVSDADMAAVESWLQSQGLQVNWISPSRIFIGFGGTVTNIGRAFGTELRYYNVNGAQRMSVADDPVIPQALAPVVKSVRGLYAIDERPLLHSATVQSTAPELTSTAGNHYIAPADFSKIYNVPANANGAGVTVGIVSWAHTNFADFDYFRSKTGTNFPNPTEIVPTAFGGIDPGPAYTTAQSCTHCLDGQMEATLDVQRVGSTVPAAGILLVVSSSSGSGGGIGADAQYLVNTSPVPAQVMSISFGGCELSAGAPGVAYWNTVFQQAAAEGISVFVSSGDSGASGCDAAFTAPPASPGANSPNYICSSQYATCVGGTQFNDTGSPSTYWSSSNGTGFMSALGYIPEGGWNESTTTSVAGSGGGVSSVIATPSWQTGTGVPTARAGRYTPDVSFTSSAHDGYFGCFAASGAGCTGNPFSFVAFAGTSAAAPSMAGVAAMLDQQQNSAQGNLNPEIYALAASNPTAFHDTTVATSGVASCSVNTVSLCNNSAPSTTSLTGGQAGYLLTTGYDQVTGWGSLDVTAFLSSISVPPTIHVLANPQSLTFPSVFVGYPSAIPLSLENTGTSSMNPLTFAIGGANAGDFSETDTCQSGLIRLGLCGVLVTFKPSAPGTRTATLSISSSNAVNSPQSVSLTGTGSTALLNPTFFVTPAASSITIAQSTTLLISVGSPTSGVYPSPTGTIVVTCGGYTSTPVAVSLMANVSIPAGSLPIGNDTLTIAYSPDAASSSLYNSASTTIPITVTEVPKISPGVIVTPLQTSITTTQSLSVTVTVSAGSGNPTPTGSVILAGGGYTSAATTLSSGTATMVIAAGVLPAGDITLTATYTPDLAGSATYISGSGWTNILVTTPPVASFTVTGTSLILAAGATSGNASTVTVTPANGFTGVVALTASITGSPSGAANIPTLSFGSTSAVTIANASAGAATLTIATTAARQGSCTASNQPPSGINWFARGGGVLACALLFGFGSRRRRFRTALGMLALLVALAGGMLACGGGSKASPCTPTTIPGTTAGVYIVTVTGTSGTTNASGTVTLTVQ